MGSGRWGGRARDDWSPEARKAAAEAREKSGGEKKPERLGFKSNERNPERMAHGNVRKFIPSREQH